jgi:hypothetical protein
MVAGCDPLSQTPRPPAVVVDGSAFLAGLERAHPPPSPAVAMAASVLRHLVDAVFTGNEGLSNMAASAASAAEYERELYHLSELQAKHHSACIKHIMMRLQAIDTQLRVHAFVHIVDWIFVVIHLRSWKASGNKKKSLLCFELAIIY